LEAPIPVLNRILFFLFKKFVGGLNHSVLIKRNYFLFKVKNTGTPLNIPVPVP
jgi:hypothetical protein